MTKPQADPPAPPVTVRDVMRHIALHEGHEGLNIEKLSSLANA